ncbi:MULTISPECIES: hypothetical protein [Alcanivorax]|nr:MULTISPECIES: hypothetical protein [Alcanivorax]
MSSSSISRRMESCIEALMEKDFEAALVHYFPALDKTAKKRRPAAKVGERIRAFLDDELEIISDIATKNIFIVNCNGVSFPEAIYKFGRTSIAHEGELDPRLNFNNNSGMEIGDTWNLPPSFITGLSIAVILAPENTAERFQKDYEVAIHEERFSVNALWGQRQLIRDKMEARYGRAIFST